MTMELNKSFLRNMYQYTLENGSKKHLCPSCGRKTFVRVIEFATGKYLAASVGRCDREANCGYQRSWKDYFRDSSGVRPGVQHKADYRRERTQMSRRGMPPVNLPAITFGRVGPGIKSDYLELEHLLETIGNYGCNSFVQFLTRLFPYDPVAVADAVNEYKIGTYQDWTSFPVINRHGRFCKAKLMKFDPATGKRLKDSEGRSLIHSLQSKLKESGRLKLDFQTDKEVFFGEHLLGKYPNLPIAIVESEKTAVIASVCKGVFPDLVWLATGSLSWLSVERVRRLGLNRTIVLYPDTDKEGKCIAKSQLIASGARRFGLTVKVSELIESGATDGEKALGFDLADYLIREQQKRNDPIRRAAFRNLVEERLAILMSDSGLSLTEAEDQLELSGFISFAENLITENSGFNEKIYLA